LTVLAVLFALGGCALDKQGVPGLTGPSELGLSLAVTATPDVLSQDGVSQAQIEVVARDGSSQPVRGLSIRVDTSVNGAVADIGTISSRTISTNNDGRASVTFVAPPPPPPTVGDDTVVTFVITPIGNNFQGSVSRTVALKLVRPGVILPPNGDPLPDFFFSPTAPRDHETILFDAVGSRDDGQIVSYHWNFGDGSTGSGVRVAHSFDLPGQYNVTLTLTDDRGRTAQTTKQVSVVVNTLPVASFTFSPTSPKANVTEVFFNASASTAALGRGIVSWEWDFGDGVHAQGQTVSHLYGFAGTYTVTLRVVDSAGLANVTSKTITIVP